jgi:hypothetical protein
MSQDQSDTTVTSKVATSKFSVSTSRTPVVAPDSGNKKPAEELNRFGTKYPREKKQERPPISEEKLKAWTECVDFLNSSRTFSFTFQDSRNFAFAAGSHGQFHMDSAFDLGAFAR